MVSIRSSYPDVAIPENVSTIDFVFEKFSQYGDREAVVDGVKGQSYTFRQLEECSRRIGSALTRRGYRKGDVFGFMSPNVPDYVLMLCAVARIGGVISGVNPLCTEDEIAYQMKQVQAKCLIIFPSLAEKALRVQRKLPCLQDVYAFGGARGCKSFQTLLADDGSAFPDINIALEDTFAIQFSSGTTGRSKGVVLPNSSILWNLVLFQSYPDLYDAGPNDVALCLLPLFHAYGLVGSMFLWLRAGTKQVTLLRFEPETFLRTVQNHKVTLLNLVPPLVLFLSQHPLVHRYDVTSVREILSGAAPLGAELVSNVTRRLPHVRTIRQAYGMTETGAGILLCPSSIRAPSSAGKLFPNMEAKILDVKTGRVLGVGEAGEVCVRGPQMMRGYLNNPEATARTIDSQGWLHTGDIGYFDADGLFYIVDRLKELIKYKGFQVPPAELEDLLLTHPSISDAAVIGIRDDEAGELPKAYVVRNSSNLTKSQVKEFVAARVVPYKKLRGGVEFVPEIPKSASGKILRKVLRDRASRAARSKL